MTTPRLPHVDKAYISPRKISDYLLSETHAVGKAKAKFFRALGYNEATSEQLKQGILDIAQTENVAEKKESPYGMKYVVDGTLQTPRGVMVTIRTVWIIDTGEDVPRFVTAHPT